MTRIILYENGEFSRHTLFKIPALYIYTPFDIIYKSYASEIYNHNSTKMASDQLLWRETFYKDENGFWRELWVEVDQTCNIWRETFYKDGKGFWCELWEEVDQTCNICLEERCKSELSNPTTHQLGNWHKDWMKICKECIKNVNTNQPPFGPGESINETNIFF